MEILVCRAGMGLAHFARVLFVLFSNLSSSNFSSSAQQFSNFSSWSRKFSNFCKSMPNFSSLKKGTSSQRLFGFPIFQVVLNNFSIFKFESTYFQFFKSNTQMFPPSKKGLVVSHFLIFQFFKISNKSPHISSISISNFSSAPKTNKKIRVL